MFLNYSFGGFGEAAAPKAPPWVRPSSTHAPILPSYIRTTFFHLLSYPDDGSTRFLGNLSVYKSLRRYIPLPFVLISKSLIYRFLQALLLCVSRKSGTHHVCARTCVRACVCTLSTSAKGSTTETDRE
jgi:hypothetical protein